jgi:hypothetical protein
VEKIKTLGSPFSPLFLHTFVRLSVRLERLRETTNYAAWELRASIGSIKMADVSAAAAAKNPRFMGMRGRALDLTVSVIATTGFLLFGYDRGCTLPS